MIRARKLLDRGNGQTEMGDGTSEPLLSSSLAPSLSPIQANDTTAMSMAQFEHEEEEHVYDAVTSLLLNVTIIGCLVFAYYVKKFRIYYLPESAGSLIVGMMLGGIARISTDNLVLFEFVSWTRANISWLFCAAKDSLIVLSV